MAANIDEIVKTVCPHLRPPTWTWQNNATDDIFRYIQPQPRSLPGADFVLATVEAKGRCIEHNNGVIRAEHMRIRALHINTMHQEKIERLTHAIGVPIAYLSNETAIFNSLLAGAGCGQCYKCNYASL